MNAARMRSLRSENQFLREVLRRHVMDWGRCDHPHDCDCSDAVARRVLADEVHDGMPGS